MITNLRFQHFKSWNDTGELRFAPLTGFFGSNSSGKTAILRFLLMLKQTVESNDQQLVLNLNGGYVELGSFEDVLSKYTEERFLDFSFSFLLENNPKNFTIDNEVVSEVYFESRINFIDESINLMRFLYRLNKFSFLMSLHETPFKGLYQYGLTTENYNLPSDEIIGIPDVIKFYELPKEIYKYYPDVDFLREPVFNLENLFRDMQYLGPIREDPKRFYQWTGEIRSLGNRGEHAVLVLLANQKRDSEARLAAKVASWLKDLGLIADFRLHQIAPNVDLHEVRVKIKPNAAEVLLNDIGFGVAQILPVLVLCASAKPGSTIILEQPEIHLHPAVQSNLADILIETIKRGVQIVLESHSEHLLHRLQRRIAEEELINTDTALYFCKMDDTGISHAVPLDVDKYGNIRNWPKDFFGDEMADLAALSRETIRRKKAEAGR